MTRKRRSFSPELKQEAASLVLDQDYTIAQTIKGLLSEEGVVIGRFMVRCLANELGLICKQPSPHAYKQATVERPGIFNHLAREFDVDWPNQVW